MTRDNHIGRDAAAFERVHAVVDRNRQDLLTLPGVLAVSVGGDGQHYRVYLHVDAKTMDKIPHEVEGVPVMIGFMVGERGPM